MDEDEDTIVYAQMAGSYARTVELEYIAIENQSETKGGLFK